MGLIDTSRFYRPDTATGVSCCVNCNTPRTEGTSPTHPPKCPVRWMEEAHYRVSFWGSDPDESDERVLENGWYAITGTDLEPLARTLARCASDTPYSHPIGARDFTLMVEIPRMELTREAEGFAALANVEVARLREEYVREMAEEKQRLARSRYQRELRELKEREEELRPEVYERRMNALKLYYRSQLPELAAEPPSEG